MLVVSYNPGYQSVLKDLKTSTRQRMVVIELDFPPPDLELEILRLEARVEPAGRRTGQLGAGDSSRARRGIARGCLDADADRGGGSDQRGTAFRDAAIAAIVGPLTDDAEVRDGLVTLIDAYAPVESGARERLSG